MQGSELEGLIKEGIPDAEVTVKGDGDHFEAIEDCSMVKQHQLVYATLGDRIGGEIHALALHTYTPDEWARQPRLQ